MTQTAVRLKTRLLPGKRLEAVIPELEEGEEVELIILRNEPQTTPEPRQFKDVIEFLDSLPPSNLTMEDWARIEREMQEEKDAWGD